MGAAPAHFRVAFLAALALLPWIACAAAQSGTSSSNATEAAALLRFKAALQGGAAALPSWNASTNMCTQWAGVGCSAGGQVTKL